LFVLTDNQYFCNSKKIAAAAATITTITTIKQLQMNFQTQFQIQTSTPKKFITFVSDTVIGDYNVHHSLIKEGTS